MKTEIISLKDWNKFSERTNSVSYSSTDGSKMLRISRKNLSGSTNPGADVLAALKKEASKTDCITKLGIPVPKVLSVVQTQDGEYGIIYEYIKGKKSISRAISVNPEKTEELIKLFCSMTKKLHSTNCDKTVFEPIDKTVESALAAMDLYTEKEKDAIRKFMSDVPKVGTCLHLDLNLSNVITAESGTYFIDLDTFGYGNPLYDIGVFRLFCLFDNDGAREKMHHMKGEHIEECYRLFLKYYFGLTTQKEIDDMTKELEPYMAAAFISHASISKNIRDQIILKNNFFSRAFEKYL